MFPTLLAPSPPLDEPSVGWIFEVFDWSIRHLDAAFFRDCSVLVNPTNEHFGGRADSARGMAELIFGSVAAYAGMAHWPLQLIEPTAAPSALPGVVEIDGPLRAPPSATSPLRDLPANAGLPVPYDPGMLSNPEAMIAGMAQNLAHHLGARVREAPPGGIENWPQTTEVIAVFMGFGLMFANTAFEFQSRSCGGCGGPRARREAYLSQYDITYALALFTTLKEIPRRDVLRHLKSSLKGHYKRCVRDVESRTEAVGVLRALAPPAVVSAL
jgi:hypothetical protein